MCTSVCTPLRRPKTRLDVRLNSFLSFVFHLRLELMWTFDFNGWDCSGNTTSISVFPPIGVPTIKVDTSPCKSFGRRPAEAQDLFQQHRQEVEPRRGAAQCQRPRRAMRCDVTQRRDGHSTASIILDMTQYHMRRDVPLHHIMLRCTVSHCRIVD